MPNNRPRAVVRYLAYQPLSVLKIIYQVVVMLRLTNIWGKTPLSAQLRVMTVV